MTEKITLESEDVALVIRSDGSANMFLPESFNDEDNDYVTVEPYITYLLGVAALIKDEDFVADVINRVNKMMEESGIKDNK